MNPSEEDVRIGVFVCHCGLNIAGSVDCEAVTEFARELPDVVVASDNKYTCSDPGQEIIKSDIKEHRLNRVVVASCTPRLHEPTFRTACVEAGLNPYLFEMANIRDHCSWVHLYDKKNATEKAKDLVKMAVARARLLKPQFETEVPVTQRAIVVGGGVAGIQAALDLADQDYQVYLVEKKPSIGGIMAQIDKTFPTMDCSICILAPKMSEVGRHPNITLYTNSEIYDVGGYVGNFHIKVLKRARYVDEKECTACGDCTEVCPVTMPNEFDVGLATRKAIYTPFAQAVPSAYIINMEDCLGDVPVACGKCIEKCERKAISFDMQDEIIDLEVGTVIIATGVDVYDPTGIPEYGYRRFENVLTSLEFERLINAGGPSGGHLLRPSDKRIPGTVAFIQCVGSRSEKNGSPYCSNVCCMNTIKDALLIKEHWPETEIKIFYLDIRAYGKGFEDLYKRSKKAGVMYIRGLPAEIKEDPGTRNLLIVAENTNTGLVSEYIVDLAILSVGIIPTEDSINIQRLFTLSKTSDGFFMESHPKLKPVDAPTQGIFFAGCAEGPKDIKDSVTQASAAASRAGILMKAGKINVEAITSVVNEDLCTVCGRCAKVCPYNAIEIDIKNKIPAHVIEAACAGCGTCGAECPTSAITMNHFTDEQIIAQIDAVTEENAERKIVAFCCNWCSYAGADFAGVSRMQYPPLVRIIRTMCSGRISEDFVLHAFQRGIAAVLVAGCHLNDCHYIDANYQTKKRVEKLWKKLDKLGIEKERLQLAWISAAEGEKFASKIKEMEEIVKKISSVEIQKTVEILS